MPALAIDRMFLVCACIVLLVVPRGQVLADAAVVPDALATAPAHRTALDAVCRSPSKDAAAAKARLASLDYPGAADLYATLAFDARVDEPLRREAAVAAIALYALLGARDKMSA